MFYRNQSLWYGISTRWMVIFLNNNLIKCVCFQFSDFRFLNYLNKPLTNLNFYLRTRTGLCWWYGRRSSMDDRIMMRMMMMMQWISFDSYKLSWHYIVKLKIVLTFVVMVIIQLIILNKFTSSNCRIISFTINNVSNYNLLLFYWVGA